MRFVLIAAIAVLIPACLSTDCENSPCSNIPAICWMYTEELTEYEQDVVFETKAFYSTNSNMDFGSCAFPPSSIGLYTVALPPELMPMSVSRRACFTMCNVLCGSYALVTNVTTGDSVRVLVTDTALNSNGDVVLSEDAFVAIGGSKIDGHVEIYLQRTV